MNIDVRENRRESRINTVGLLQLLKHSAASTLLLSLRRLLIITGQCNVLVRSFDSSWPTLVALLARALNADGGGGDDSLRVEVSVRRPASVASAGKLGDDTLAEKSTYSKSVPMKTST